MEIFFKFLQEINQSIYSLSEYIIFYINNTSINKLISCLITKIKITLLVMTNNSF